MLQRDDVYHLNRRIYDIAETLIEMRGWPARTPAAVALKNAIEQAGRQFITALQDHLPEEITRAQP